MGSVTGRPPGQQLGDTIGSECALFRDGDTGVSESCNEGNSEEMWCNDFNVTI